MKGSLRQSMAWLHGWVGLVLGWLMFIVFLFGTASFFNPEISAWMRPELRPGPISDAALVRAFDHLATRATARGPWTLTLPAARGGEPISVGWQGDEAHFQPVDGTPVTPRQTRGGAFLFSFHYNLYYLPWLYARYLVGLASLGMLVALISGLIIHKRIFADFFTLRLGKGPRSWLDGHNVTSILALPFHVMITYTGLVTLMFTLMPWGISANFPDRSSFAAAIRPSPVRGEVIATPAPMLPLPALLQQARAATGGLAPTYLILHDPGTVSAMAEVHFHVDRLGGRYNPLYFNAVTGQPLLAPFTPGPALATYGVMTDLHTGRFAAPLLRWLYFLSGVAGTAMVATGVILWIAKRQRQSATPRAHHLVERLNIGIIVGGLGALAVYFLANRLLPLGMAHRAEWEINSLFIAWGALLAWAGARPPRKAWVELLAGTALLYVLVPVMNLLTTSRGLHRSLMEEDWAFAGFDLMMLVLATSLAACARRVIKPQ